MALEHGSGSQSTTRVALVAVALAAAHHLDHVLRGEDGWPFATDVNAFTWSLVLYPAFALELILARRRAAAASALRLSLAGTGLAVVTVLHVGPFGVDRLAAIPNGYANPVAGAVALLVAIALIVSLCTLVVLQVRARRLV